VIEIGTPTVGIWCDVCDQPTAFEARVLTIGPDGVNDDAVVRRCIHCNPVEEP
jgi:hypothetical protein